MKVQEGLSRFMRVQRVQEGKDGLKRFKMVQEGSKKVQDVT